MNGKYISFNKYSYLMNRIAYWLVKNNIKFNTRQVYGYFGRQADYGTLVKVIKQRGTNYGTDALVNEFVECAIFDNRNLNFLPNYVTDSDNKTKYNKSTYVNMANRVSAYEVTNGKSPKTVEVIWIDTPITSNTSSLKSYLTNTGCSGMGQCTPYYCACNSLQQAFYRLTGIHVAESTIAKVAGTTTAGTGHAGINTAVAWFNKKYGKNVKIQWKNFSDLGSTQTERFKNLQTYINRGAVFFHLLYRNRYGHYEVPKAVNTSNKTITVLNSLGSKCNSPAYCGYIENRSYKTQQSYISGISQKSLCILTL